MRQLNIAENFRIGLSREEEFWMTKDLRSSTKSAWEANGSITEFKGKLLKGYEKAGGIRIEEDVKKLDWRGFNGF